MNLWHDLALGPQPPELIHIVVEIPGNTRNKYEYDHERGIFHLNRVLAAPLHYPADYGLIPRTLYDDGDPLDALVMIKEPTFPGCIVTARPLALFRMDDQGTPDDKVLAVVDDDPLYHHYRDLSDIAGSLLEELAHFFNHYKDLEGKRVQTHGWLPQAKATEAICRSHKKYTALQS